jgi:hypothetical protein
MKPIDDLVFEMKPIDNLVFEMKRSTLTCLADSSNWLSVVARTLSQASSSSTNTIC